MPHANPTPSIAYASHLGARTPSSAAPLPHAHPAPASPNSPFNEQQTTNNKPQSTDNKPSTAPPSSSPRFDHCAPHFSLFLQVLHIASTVIVAIAQRMDSDLHCLTLLQGCEAINCLYSIIRIQLTIDRHPERITPAELRRLSKASRYINRLARQKLDFSPFTTTQDNEQQAPNNKQTSNPQSPIRNPQLTLPRLNVSGLSSTPICHSPGATLARTCQSLCRILKLLPDLEYDPSGTVATLALSPGARASSPAIPLPPANPATLAPISPFVVPPLGGYAPMPTNPATPSPNIPINEQQTTDHKPQTTTNEPFPIPHFSNPQSKIRNPQFSSAPT